MTEPDEPRTSPDRDLEWRLHAMLDARADALEPDLHGPRLRAAAQPRRRPARFAPALAAAAAVAAVAVGVAVFAGGADHAPRPPVQPGGVSGSRSAPSGPTRPPVRRTTPAVVPSPTSATLAPRSVPAPTGPAPTTTPSVSAPRTVRSAATPSLRRQSATPRRTPSASRTSS